MGKHEAYQQLVQRLDELREEQRLIGDFAMKRSDLSKSKLTADEVEKEFFTVPFYTKDESLRIKEIESRCMIIRKTLKFLEESK